MAEKRLSDAQALLEHALRLHPGDAAATEALGNVFVMQRRPDLALPYLSQFAAFHPGGSAINGSFVVHNGRVNVAHMDAHVEALRDRRVVEIQRPEFQAEMFHPYK